MVTGSNKGRLSAEQVEQFARDGYTVFQSPVFPERKFGALKSFFEEDLERHGEDGLDVIHFKDPRFFQFLLSDEVLDLVESLIGPDIALWSSHFISKPALTGKATPWHEDSSYWNGRLSTMADIVTVWLAIDRTWPENGSMAVIPGSQHGGFSEYSAVDSSKNIFDSEIKSVDESKAVYFTLEPNECSLHEGRIIHGAKPNTSPHRRAGYTMRYFPTTTKFYDESPRNSGHKIWLARGKDHAGNVYEPPPN